LVPQTAGELTLPALEYSFFDPATGSYQTMSTPPIQVSVAPGNAPQVSNPVPAPAQAQETSEQPATALRQLKVEPAGSRFLSRPVTASPFYWLAWGVPLLGLIGNFIWTRRQQFRQNNPALVRSSQAGRKARQALARQEGGPGGAGQILTTYLADKLNEPVAGLTRQALTRLLTEKGLETTLVERVTDHLAEVELHSYAPAAESETRNLFKRLDQLIRDLEQVF
jgi:hypothetical protein